MLGLGQYDVNVMIVALQRRGFEAVWFDRRKWVFDLVDDVLFNLDHILYSLIVILFPEIHSVSTHQMF